MPTTLIPATDGGKSVVRKRDFSLRIGNRNSVRKALQDGSILPHSPSFDDLGQLRVPGSAKNFPNEGERRFGSSRRPPERDR